VEIVHDENGKPCVVFSADLREKLFGQKIVTVHLSISHSEHYALAMAVIEEREE
jgi:holo-[acyl-carrier protein] synthase